MAKQLYTAKFIDKNITYIYWGRRNERVRGVTLIDVRNCKGMQILESTRTRSTTAWNDIPLKNGDIVQFYAEKVGNRLYYVKGVKIIGHE